MKVVQPHTLLALLTPLTLPIPLKHCLHNAYMPTYIATYIIYGKSALELWVYGFVGFGARSGTKWTGYKPLRLL